MDMMCNNFPERGDEETLENHSQKNKGNELDRVSTNKLFTNEFSFPLITT